MFLLPVRVSPQNWMMIWGHNLLSTLLTLNSRASNGLLKLALLLVNRLKSCLDPLKLIAELPALVKH